MNETSNVRNIDGWKLKCPKYRRLKSQMPELLMKKTQMSEWLMTESSNTGTKDD